MCMCISCCCCVHFVFIVAMVILQRTQKTSWKPAWLQVRGHFFWVVRNLSLHMYIYLVGSKIKNWHHCALFVLNCVSCPIYKLLETTGSSRI